MPVPPPLPLQTKAPPADNPLPTLLQFQFLDNVGEQWWRSQGATYVNQMMIT